MENEFKFVLGKPLAKEDERAGENRLRGERRAKGGKSKKEEELISYGNGLSLRTPCPQDHQDDNPAQEHIKQIEYEPVLECSREEF